MRRGTSLGTVAGMVMGTVGYMAPEQVRGQALDRRADIFAFGAVLLEMLTGRGAFACETPADTMSAILNSDPPDLDTVSGDVSPLARIVRRCLEKNPSCAFNRPTILPSRSRPADSLKGSHRCSCGDLDSAG